MKQFIKKHWFIILIIIISITRFLFTYKLPSFYLSNLNYDDNLMIKNMISLLSKSYLGVVYTKKLLIKGAFFPFLLMLIRIYKISYSSAFTLLYILSCIYFLFSLKKIINNKKILIIFYLFLIFNPVTYSQDLFQRLYRNTISITELLFFLGCLIRVLFQDDKKIINCILFGTSLSFMFLTREDNIWVYPIILFIIVYNYFNNKKIKTIIINLIPIIILVISLNIVSFINYKHYGIYTYNEIQKSEFHNTYKKILQIKDSEKIEKVSIPKSTFYKLAENSKVFNMDKEKIDDYYNKHAGKNGEIYNGNIIWYFRDMMYCNNNLKNGKESEKFYKKLGIELDELFDKGVFEKEFIMPSIFMSTPTKKDVFNLPGNVLKTVLYTTSYKNIKTLTDTSKYEYDKKAKAYTFKYKDYHHTVDIVKKNPLKYEIIRQIYKYLTIVLSIISLIVYFKNLFNFDKYSIISHLLVICYCLIIGGVAYTHTTSFHSIRPLYLGNVYILQCVFIMINMYRIKSVKNR